MNLWYDGDWSGDYGIDLPADTPRREVALEFLGSVIGGTEGDHKPGDIERAEKAVRWQPLFSVLARDRDDLGDDVQWHSDGSGKRCKPAWFIDACVLRSIEDGD